MDASERAIKIAIGVTIVVVFIVFQTAIMLLTEWLAKKAIRKLRERCQRKEKPKWWDDIERQQLNGEHKLKD